MKFIICLIVLSLYVSLCATEVSGNQSGTWTAENSPYYVVGNVNIPSGEILEINPGVEVIFNGDHRITAFGSIEAIGTETDSVFFYGNNGMSWDRIRLESSTVTSLFEYCSIRNADVGIYSFSSPVDVNNSIISECTTGVHVYGIGNPNPPFVNITNNLIMNCQQNGVLVSQNTNTVIEFNEIRNCAISGQPRGAIQLSNQSAGGSNSPVIRYNHIHSNNWQGISAWDIAATGAINPLIEDNLIEYNLTGIYLINTGGIIRNNEISNNFVAGNPDSGAGVMLNGASTYPFFSENIITGNFTGFYLIQGATAMLGDISSDDPNSTGMNQIYGNVGPNGDTNSVYSLSTADIMAQNNIWDSEDYDEIAETIHDGNNQAGLGFVIFDPIYTPAVLYPPENLQALAGDQSVFLNWLMPAEAEGVLGYNIYRDNELINQELLDETEFYDIGLVNGFEYSYYVTAYYEQGESDPSNTVVAVPFTNIPGLVYNPDPEDNATGVPVNLKEVSWFYFSGESYPDPDYFKIYISDDESLADHFFHKVIPFESGVEEYTIDGLPFLELNFKTIYFWRVMAVKLDDEEEVEYYDDAQPVWSFTTEKESSCQQGFPGYEEKNFVIYPNPVASFRNNITLSFSLKSESNVSIDIFNLKGQKVKSVLNNWYLSGTHEFYWENLQGRGLSRGVYFVRLKTENKSQIQKILILK